MRVRVFHLPHFQTRKKKKIPFHIPVVSPAMGWDVACAREARSQCSDILVMVLQRRTNISFVLRQLIKIDWTRATTLNKCTTYNAYNTYNACVHLNVKQVKSTARLYLFVCWALFLHKSYKNIWLFYVWFAMCRTWYDLCLGLGLGIVYKFEFRTLFLVFHRPLANLAFDVSNHFNFILYYERKPFGKCF